MSKNIFSSYKGDLSFKNESSNPLWPTHWERLCIIPKENVVIPIVHEIYAFLKHQIVEDGTGVYVTVVTVREVPLFLSNIFEFYDISSCEKDFTNGVDLDRLQNIDINDVIKYLTQAPTHHDKGMNSERADSEDGGDAQDLLGTEDEYEAVFQP
ncbi:hypothetical protein J1N35_019580 [Gossypium stocksii]|uniref:Uncharacterized protein n=1 Tax=Gossypium stocksii TaxID=47602 RepID=A0A9D3VSS5_9ROSI|nr:hypothetical protein J1N35_019580 [Gossypium stocksii]